MENLKKAIPLLFVFSAILALTLPPQAHAATGVVCIADPSLNPSSCPNSLATLSGTVGANVTVAVNIQGSDTLNGFDISVAVNPTMLQPLQILTSNSIIHDPKLTAYYLVNATSGIARLAMVAQGYSVPGTGNLFDIVYKSVSAGNSSIIFQSGCSGTSVPNTCVTIANPSGAADSEKVQTGSFSGSATPDFTISAKPTTLTVRLGSMAQSMITVTSLNGFSGTINFSLSLSPNVKKGPTVSLSQSALTLSSGGTATTTLLASPNG